MFVLGTAGHIDHGKSSIIKRLTGIDPDRLPEEKQRGLTIDLGFAWMELPSGKHIGFVDVPGHEKFVKNMIAGVGSIDAVLLVIAADDGWMPQTEEHLQILELLGVKKGLIVLNKIDLVEPEWVELVSADIEKHLEGRQIEFSGILPVSAMAGTGFEELTAAIDDLLKLAIERADIGKPRLFADRAFVITGMGSIVTGTLTGGKLRVGDEVTLYPVNEKARIRNLQTHKESIDVAVPGSRVAVNLTGSEKRNFKRGIMICGLEDLITTKIINCHFGIPPQGQIPLKHNMDVVFLLGTAEIIGKALLIDNAMIKPGESGFGRIRLPEPVCPFVGDKFIIRLPSPAATIGGGIVLDFTVKGRIRTNDKQWEYLKSLHPVTVENIVTSVLLKNGFWGPEETRYFRNSIFSQEQIQSRLESLTANAELSKSREFYFSNQFIDNFRNAIKETLRGHHQEYPWSSGLSAKELLDNVDIKLGDAGNALLGFLQQSGELTFLNGNYSLPEHSANLPPQLQKLASNLTANFLSNPFESPSRSEIEKEGKNNQIVVKYLLNSGIFVDCGGGIMFHKEIFDECQRKVVNYLAEKGKAKSSELRQLLGTSRKYAIPLLEKLDQLRITVFDGEFRSLSEKR